MAKRYTLYKSDIIRRVHKALPEYSKNEIKMIIDQYNEEIKDALEGNHDVSIVNFGKFDTAEVERYFHYNNLTDEVMAETIKYRKVTFSASNNLKNRLNKKK